MAKRKKPPVRDEGKSRFELRFDEDLYGQIKYHAEQAEVSVNQLMQGLARWAMRHVHTGEPVQVEEDWQHGEEGGIHTRPQPGVLWFGQAVVETSTDAYGNKVTSEPRVFFQLDFTERHVVREDWPETGATE